jgi:hypothetical protein
MRARAKHGRQDNVNPSHRLWTLGLSCVVNVTLTTLAASGCSAFAPKTGNEGEACVVGLDSTYCYGDLQCVNDKCVSPSQPPSPYCTSSDATLCGTAAGTQAFLCQDGAGPTPVGFVDCARSRPMNGETLFCCVPKPGCEALSWSGTCGAPSTEYVCTDPAVPEDDAGAPVPCLPFEDELHAFTASCCLSTEACIPFSLPSCGGGDDPWVCTGSAMPPDLDASFMCRSADPDAGDPRFRGYCCTKIITGPYVFDGG